MRRHAITGSARAAQHRRPERARPLVRPSEERLLALQRTAGNQSVQRLLVQRDDTPGAGSGLTFPRGGRPSLLGGEQLHLDPEIEAQAAAYRARMELERILHPPDMLTALQDLPLTLDPPPNPALSGAPPAHSAPLVPAGAGPATARAGTGGDMLSAVTAVPAVGNALTRLKTDALGRVSRDWSRLSTGDRVVLITSSVLIGGGALAGVASSPDGRRFMFDQLNGRDLPVPGVDGLSVKFNTRADNLGVMFTYDLAPLISRATGM